MRVKTMVFQAAAVAAALLFAAPAAAQWWEWAAPEVDPRLLESLERGVRERDRGDVFPRDPRDRDRRDERRGDDRWERERRERDDRWERDRRGRDGDWDRRGRDDRRGRSRGRDAGPPFCRNGEGHPVFGMEWCREKGFGRGGRWGGPDRWRPYDPSGVVFERRPRSGTFGERVLGEILGRVIVDGLVSHRSDLGLGGELEGRWFVPRDRPLARVLQVRAGDVPLAELTDLDGDGRADVALLMER
jgi:hypothetical protein